MDAMSGPLTRGQTVAFGRSGIEDFLIRYAIHYITD
jgi:hypothetical protein